MQKTRTGGWEGCKPTTTDAGSEETVDARRDLMSRCAGEISNRIRRFRSGKGWWLREVEVGQLGWFMWIVTAARVLANQKADRSRLVLEGSGIARVAGQQNHN